MNRHLLLGEQDLALSDLLDVVRRRRPVGLAESARAAMADSAAWVESVVAGGADGQPSMPVYSINTGVGALAGREVFPRADDAIELSRRTVMANACGVGADVDEEVVRATMLLRAASVARGHSGIRPGLVDTLLAMLNSGVHPAIPEYGSLGASGDLVPLAHVALVLSRDRYEDRAADSGEAYYQGTRMPGVAAMRMAGIERVVLAAKEGSSLINGTCFSTALCALALADAENLVEAAEVAYAMSAEALLAFGDALAAPLHAVRGQVGQMESAARLRRLLAGSQLIDGGEDRDPVRQPPQDAYSLRCMPQVLGAVRDVMKFVGQIVRTELNAATDNPLIFLDLPPTRSLKAVSGGNFHAEYLAFAADFLAIAVTEVGNIAERRLFRLNDGSLNRGLPDMLIAGAQVGLDSGYMMPQYVAAALVSDCKTLAHPDSVDSIPTCANQEDHVSMAANAGRHARQVVANIETVVGIELLMAAQALELRLASMGLARHALAPATREVLELIRSHPAGDGHAIGYLTKDVILYPLIEVARELVHSGEVAAVARAFTDPDARSSRAVSGASAG